MTRSEKFESDLKQLAKLIGRKAMTARAIAERVKCSKPTVYARLEALERRGYVVNVKQERAGSRGPTAAVFSITA